MTKSLTSMNNSQQVNKENTSQISKNYHHTRNNGHAMWVGVCCKPTFIHANFILQFTREKRFVATNSAITMQIIIWKIK